MFRQRNFKGTIGEFLGLIFFVIIVLGVLIPSIVEILAYTNQAQEVDRLTKAAAKKACSLQADSANGIALDLRQSNLGVATTVGIMQRIAQSVIVNEATNPQSYLENTRNGQDVDLRLYDMLGAEINIRDKSPNNPFFIEVTDPGGGRDTDIRVGTNAEGSLCPSGGGADWRYCMDQANDNATLEALRNNGLGNPIDNTDLIQRVEKFQAGRCDPTDPNCRNDFSGRLDHCTVCTTKTRESIFRRTIFDSVLSCSSAGDQSLLPCAITTCATEKFVQVSAKRGYNTAYKDNSRLGAQFNAREIHPQSDDQTRHLLSDQTIVPETFVNNTTNLPINRTKYQKVQPNNPDDPTNQIYGEDTVQFYQNMNRQFNQRQ